MTTNSVFSVRLTTVREERGIKRQKAADDLGITRASLEYYEKGMRKPDTEMLLKICSYYKVSADYLLGLSNAQITATDNEKLKNACDYTGLNELSVKTLHDIEDYRLLPVFNKLISNYVFVDIADAAVEYWRALGGLIDDLQKMINSQDTRDLECYSFDSTKAENDRRLTFSLVGAQNVIYKMADSRIKEYNSLLETAKQLHKTDDTLYDLERPEDSIIRFDNSD